MTDSTRQPILLNTRPSPMGDELSALCQQQQLATLDTPIIDTLATAPDIVTPKIAQSLAHCDNQSHYWIFISRTAVRHFHEAINGLGAEFAPKGQVIAVGPGSRDELELAFPQLTGLVICPDQANSDGVIQLPQLTQATPYSVTLLKGQGGRDVIQQHVTNQGQQLDAIDLYQRVVRQYSAKHVVNWQACPFILATSIDIADGVLQNVHNQLSAEQAQTWIESKYWIVLSPRIAKHLEQSNINRQSIRIAADTNNQAIIAVLTSWHEEMLMTKKDQKVSTKTARATPSDKDVKQTTDTPEQAMEEVTNVGSKASSQAKSQHSSKKSDDALARLNEEIRQAKTAEAKPASSDAQAKTKGNPKADHLSDEKTTVTPATPKAKPTNNGAANRLSKTAVFAVLLSLVCLTGLGFIWWQSQMWLKTQSQLELLNEQAVKNNLNQINTLQLELNKLNRQLTSQTQQHNTSKQAMSALTQRVSELGQSQPNQWLAAEASYLVNIAERKLIIDQDVDTAQMLLANAANRLTAMNDPSVFHLRESISKDIAKLRDLPTPDRDSIYLSLSGILDLIPTLKFSHYYIPQPQPETTQQAVTESVDDWQTNLATSFHRFMSNFVTIKRRDANIEPQIPEQQQWFVRANLNRQILLAQQSVLQQNNTLYVDALTRTITWMQQYFDLTDPQVVAAINTLSELQSQNVALNLPSNLNSQAELANFVMQQLALKNGQ